MSWGRSHPQNSSWRCTGGFGQWWQNSSRNSNRNWRSSSGSDWRSPTHNGWSDKEDNEGSGRWECDPTWSSNDWEKASVSSAEPDAERSNPQQSLADDRGSVASEDVIVPAPVEQEPEPIPESTLPTASPVRGSFPQSSDTAALSEEFSRDEAEVVAVSELRDAGQLDEADMPTFVEPASIPDVGDWPVMPEPPLPEYYLEIVNLVVDEEWPEFLTLTRVQLIPPQAEWNSLAFLSAPKENPHGFALSLALGEGNPVARLEPEVLAWPAENSREKVLEFHKVMATSAGLGDDLQQCLHIPVLMKAAEGLCVIDWEGMESTVGNDARSNLPVWLRLLWRRANRLLRLQQVGACCSPITPIPNPLRMEAVLGSDWGIEALDTLQFLGRKVLKLFFSIVCFVKHPFDDAALLTRRSRAARVDERLAALFVHSGLLQEIQPVLGWKPQVDGIDIETAAGTLNALVGAFMTERGGDFFSVAKLWQWLLRTTDAAGCDELKTAVKYLCCATKAFKGRTPTYETLCEVEYDGRVCLQINYALYGTVLYCRPDVAKNRFHGQELLLSGTGKCWENVVYDSRLGSFVSPSLVVFEPGPEGGGTFTPAAMPNKASKWQRGTSLAALVKLKRGSNKSLVYEALREMKDGSLWVYYQNKGWAAYERCSDGGIGFERANKEPRRPVVYSERADEKTLLSRFFDDKPLPNLIADWLLSSASLSRLVTPTATQRDQVQIEDKGDHIKWTDATNQQVWTCTRCYEKCAIIFCARKGSGEEQELLFDGETWAASTGMDQESRCILSERYRLPEAVVKWLRCTDEVSNPIIFKKFLEQRAEMSWWPLPPQLRSCFPRLAETTIGHLEHALHHTFSNPLLLAEALTHTSANQTILTPDCQRLAAVGAAATEELVARILFEAATCTVGTLATGTATKYDTFAVARTSRLPIQWPEPASSACSVPSTHGEFQERWEASCNHVAYAWTCVDLQLYKGIIAQSPALLKSIRSFVKVVARATNDPSPQMGWGRLLSHDAPRILGDVFLACIGAVVMDGGDGYLHAEEVVRQHVHECSTLELPVDMMTSQNVTERIRPEDLTDDEEEEEEEAQGAGSDQDRADQNDGLAVWCEECETWLNGRTQWRDHLIGKKHKKKCKAAPKAKAAAKAANGKRQGGQEKTTKTNKRDEEVSGTATNTDVAVASQGESLPNCH